MVSSLEAQLEEVDRKKGEIRGKIEERNSRKKIECAVDSCGKLHPINKLILLQTHWYTPPSGCTGGDYWNYGEMQFICPDTKVRNRIMIHSFYDSDRSKYNKDNEDSFSSNYRSFFKEIIDVHEYNSNSYGRDSETWRRSGEKENMSREEVAELVNPNLRNVNNHYVDQNKKKFGLVERKKNNSD